MPKPKFSLISSVHLCGDMPRNWRCQRRAVIDPKSQQIIVANEMLDSIGRIVVISDISHAMKNAWSVLNANGGKIAVDRTFFKQCIVA